jgi:hypothetical protein
MREPVENMNETQQERERAANIERSREEREERERPADIQQAREERARMEANHDPSRRPLPGTTDPRMTEAQAAHMTDESRHQMVRQPDSSSGSRPTPLFGTDEASGFRDRWETVQGEFVDDPRHAVEDADRLVSDAIQRLSKVFANERSTLEQQWKRGDDVDTEDLRLALTKYRSFFERLLAA